MNCIFCNNNLIKTLQYSSIYNCDECLIYYYYILDVKSGCDKLQLVSYRKNVIENNFYNIYYNILYKTITLINKRSSKYEFSLESIPSINDVDNFIQKVCKLENIK